MLIGLHVSAAGGADKAPERARAAGGDVLQLFLSSPRMWRQKMYTNEEAFNYQKACKDNDIQASFAHEMYLTSYGTPDSDNRLRSITVLQNSLINADLLGITGIVTHLGSHKGLGFDQSLKRLSGGILKALKDSKTSYAILENSAGSGGNIGNSIKELAAIYEALGRHPRVKFCLDTAHLLTSGYDIRTQEGLDKTLSEFNKLIGLENLVVMHLNDSKADIGTRVDRHENIGDGFIGNDGFKVILNHPKLKDIPGILEVPGLEGSGPDKANIDRLKALQNG